MLNVIVMQLPGAMYDCAILLDLFWCEWLFTLCKTMRSHRHDIGCSIREPDASPSKGHLHHVFSKVARRVQQVLMRRCDVATRSVIVSPKVCGDTPALSRRQ